jgi:tellurite resistance protein TerC
MKARLRTEQSIDSPSWTKRLSGIWNVENIKVVRRVIISVVGATVLLIGVALLVLPGPAFIVIPIGLAILASEYAWARRWLKKSSSNGRRSVSVRSRTNPEGSAV